MGSATAASLMPSTGLVSAPDELAGVLEGPGVGAALGEGGGEGEADGGVGGEALGGERRVPGVDGRLVSWRPLLSSKVVVEMSSRAVKVTMAMAVSWLVAGTRSAEML